MEAGSFPAGVGRVEAGTGTTVACEGRRPEGEGAAPSMGQWPIPLVAHSRLRAMGSGGARGTTNGQGVFLEKRVGSGGFKCKKCPPLTGSVGLESYDPDC